jgi:hypothetical protein
MRDSEGVVGGGGGALITIVAVAAAVVLLLGLIIGGLLVRRTRGRRHGARPLTSTLPTSSSGPSRRSPSRPRSRERSRRTSQSRVGRAAAASSNYAAVNIGNNSTEYTGMPTMGDGSVASSPNYVTLSDFDNSSTDGYARHTPAYGSVDPSRRAPTSPSDDYQSGDLGLM